MTRGALLGKRLVRAGNIGANDWREQPLARTSRPGLGRSPPRPRHRVGSAFLRFMESRAPGQSLVRPHHRATTNPTTQHPCPCRPIAARIVQLPMCVPCPPRKAMPPSRSPSAGLCRRFHACAQISPFAASEAAGRRVGEKGSPARQAFWLTGLRGARAVRCRYTSATSCAQALGFLRMLRPQYVSTSHPLR